MLVTLACSPDPHTSYTDVAWVRPVEDAVRGIRDDLVAAHHRSERTLCISTLTAWSTRLHRVLTDAASASPDRWHSWLEPGSWLERNVRLYTVLTALTETHPDESSEVAFAEMDVARRLGWPSWALPREALTR